METNEKCNIQQTKVHHPAMACNAFVRSCEKPVRKPNGALGRLRMNVVVKFISAILQRLQLDYSGTRRRLTILVSSETSFEVT